MRVVKVECRDNLRVHYFTVGFRRALRARRTNCPLADHHVKEDMKREHCREIVVVLSGAPKSSVGSSPLSQRNG